MLLFSSPRFAALYVCSRYRGGYVDEDAHFSSALLFNVGAARSHACLDGHGKVLGVSAIYR